MRLIHGHVGIDRTCPGVYAAVEIDQRTDVLLFEELDDLPATHAMVADDDDFLMRVEGIRRMRSSFTLRTMVRRNVLPVG